MQRFKIPLTAILVGLIAMDFVIISRLWVYGVWPVDIISTSPKEGVAEIEFRFVTFTAVDWVILVLLIGLLTGLHALLAYLVWKAWRSSPVRRTE